MKSSDLKVVAIILSIALFFTIITSNAVSIASVVILAKGGTGTTVQSGTTGGTVAGTTGGTVSGTTGGTVSGTTGGTASGDTGATVTPDANAGGSTATTPSGNAGTTGSTAGNAGTTGSTAGNAGSTAGSTGGSTADANDPILADPLGAYQKAAKEINQKGAAGYNKIGWQKILKIEGLGILDGAVTSIIGGFMTDESEATVKENAKGSDDSKNRMPPSDCDKKYVKSATAKKEGELYIVTIVMNEQINPSYQDADGLVKMSKEFLAYADVQDTVKNDATVSKIVESLDGQIVYKDYTITATMNSKGQFVDITHYGVGYIDATLNGSLHANGELEFNAKYYDFAY